MKIIIGDIHACTDELERLFDKIGRGSEDEVYCLGDMFDRGPDNSKMLRLLTEDPQFLALKGNHERKHLLVYEKKCRPSLSQLITKQELGENYSALLHLARNLPAFIELDEAVLVHGSIEPGVPLEKQRETVLVSSLSGERYLGKLGRPWYEMLDIEKPVIFGHKCYEKPFVFQDKVFGINTGCCMGGSLTAITLPDFRIYSVDAAKNHWQETVQKYKPRISVPE